MIVLDANVMIAFLSTGDPHHREAVDLLDTLADRPFSANCVTLAETLVYPARVSSDQAEAAAAALDAIGVETIGLGAGDAVRLARLRASSGMKMPDAIVLLTAITTSAGLATFDERLASAARAEKVEVFGA